MKIIRTKITTLIPFIFTILIFFNYSAHATFSIVAVDPVTGEVGGAGASCINNIDTISAIVPGRGAINAQSALSSSNREAARERMIAGDSPQQILDYMFSNDSSNNPQSRQWVIVDLDSNNTPRSASFTGSGANNQKRDITGDGYATAGNILLNASLIDAMESAFNNASGRLEDKLMAALQEGNYAGADSRCQNEGVSSLSAFVKVAKPGDSDNNLYMDLVIDSTPFGVEPIDELQILFDEFKANGFVANDNFNIFPDSGVVNLDVLANDNGIGLSIISVSQGSQGGTVSNLSNSINYTAAAGFSGVEEFSYTAQDNSGETGTGTVTVNVSNEIVVDDQDPNTSSTGSWLDSSGTGPWGDGSVYCDSNCTYTWSPNLSDAGEYEIFVWYTPHDNRINNVPYTVSHGSGSDTVLVDQQQSTSQWFSIGSFSFNSGTSDITISTSSGQANADAVRLVLVSSGDGDGDGDGDFKRGGRVPGSQTRKSICTHSEVHLVVFQGSTLRRKLKEASFFSVKSGALTN